MSYCTLAQLIERYGEPMLVALTERAETPAHEIDADAVARAIADTGALIDGYLKGRYRLPLSETPPLLTDLALTVTVYRLHRLAASDKVRRDYEDAMKTLREIAAGTVRLDLDGAEPEGSGATGVRTNDRKRDMTPDNLKGFV